MFRWQVEKAIGMAKAAITEIGGDCDMWESRLIEAFDGYHEEDDEEEEDRA
jgi:hypothetical protein